MRHPHRCFRSSTPLATGYGAQSRDVAPGWRQGTSDGSSQTSGMAACQRQWCARRFERRNVGIGEVLKAHDTPIAALQPLILLDRDHHSALAAIARYSNRLLKRQVLISADVALEFGGRYFNHCSDPVL